MSRPDQVGLVVVVFAAGVASAAATGSAVRAVPVAAGLSMLLAVAVSVHLVNEYADHAADARTVRTRFSGGSGVLAELGVARTWALRVAVLAAAVALTGAVVAVASGWLSGLAAALLVTGLVGGWQYSVGPLRLSWRGWGEVANALLGGLLLPVYGIAVVRGGVTGGDVAVFVPFALLVFVNLLETQWPDRATDAAVGKRTLVVRWSAASVRGLAAVITAAAYAGVLLLAPEPLPRLVTAAAFVALPLSVWTVRRLTIVTTPLPGVLAMVTSVVAQLVAWSALALR